MAEPRFIRAKRARDGTAGVLPKVKEPKERTKQLLRVYWHILCRYDVGWYLSNLTCEKSREKSRKRSHVISYNIWRYWP